MECPSRSFFIVSQRSRLSFVEALDCLPDYSLGLVVGDRPDETIQAVADHVNSSFRNWRAET